MKRPRRLRRLDPDPELIRRRAAGETLRELAGDYDVAHTTLSRYFARPNVTKQLKQAEELLRAEERAAEARSRAEQRAEREAHRQMLAARRRAASRGRSEEASELESALTQRPDAVRAKAAESAEPEQFSPQGPAAGLVRIVRLDALRRVADDLEDEESHDEENHGDDPGERSQTLPTPLRPKAFRARNHGSSLALEAGTLTPLQRFAASSTPSSRSVAAPCV